MSPSVGGSNFNSTQLSKCAATHKNYARKTAPCSMTALELGHTRWKLAPSALQSNLTCRRSMVYKSLQSSPVHLCRQAFIRLILCHIDVNFEIGLFSGLSILHTLRKVHIGRNILPLSPYLVWSIPSTFAYTRHIKTCLYYMAKHATGQTCLIKGWTLCRTEASSDRRGHGDRLHEAEDACVSPHRQHDGHVSCEKPRGGGSSRIGGGRSLHGEALGLTTREEAEQLRSAGFGDLIFDSEIIDDKWNEEVDEEVSSTR